MFRRLLISVVLGLLISNVRVAPVFGDSLSPTLEEGYLIYIITKEVNRGDIIISEINETKIVKRILGVKGDYIVLGGEIYVNGNFYHEASLDYHEIYVNDYFLIGDNMSNSFDSTTFGEVTDIEGKVLFNIKKGGF